MDVVTIKLETPVTVVDQGKEKTYSELEFTRTMRGKDLVAMDAVEGQVRKSFALYASMAGVPIQLFNELTTDDFEAVALAVAPLMGKRGAQVKGMLERQALPDGAIQ